MRIEYGVLFVYVERRRNKSQQQTHVHRAVLSVCIRKFFASFSLHNGQVYAARLFIFMEDLAVIRMKFTIPFLMHKYGMRLISNNKTIAYRIDSDQKLRIEIDLISEHRSSCIREELLSAAAYQYGHTQYKQSADCQNDGQRIHVRLWESIDHIGQSVSTRLDLLRQSGPHRSGE